LPRWVEAVSIAGAETHFCTTGTAVSKNNCGGIRPKGAVTGFVDYSTDFESVKAISDLINRPLYKDKSIEEMNGIYCTEEVGSPDGVCPRWEKTINKHIDNIIFN